MKGRCIVKMFFFRPNEKQIIQQEKQWEKDKLLIERQQKIKEERHALVSFKPSTTKIIMVFLFLNCTLVEIFTGWATVQSLNIALETMTYVDFTPLTALVGAVVSEVIGFGVYAVKATKENTTGGIVYEQAMLNAEINENECVG